MLKSGLKSNLASREAFHAFGLQLGKEATPGDIFTLYGPMGAGKTTLVKGIVQGALGVAPHIVTSPTFTLLNIYDYQEALNKSVYHFDLYRLKSEQEFFRLGFEEYLSLKGIVCIEWSERIDSFLSTLPRKMITISFSDQDSRVIHYEVT